MTNSALNWFIAIFLSANGAEGSPGKAKLDVALCGMVIFCSRYFTFDD